MHFSHPQVVGEKKGHRIKFTCHSNSENVQGSSSKALQSQGCSLYSHASGGAQDCSQGKLQWKEVKNNRCDERVTNTAEGDLEIWSHGYYGVAVLKGWYQQRK